MEAANRLAMVDPKAFSVPGMSADAATFWSRVWPPLTSGQKDPRRGTIGPSIDKMTDQQACDVAQSIVSLNAMVDSFLENQP